MHEVLYICEFSECEWREGGERSISPHSCAKGLGDCLLESRSYIDASDSGWEGGKWLIEGVFKVKMGELSGSVGTGCLKFSPKWR